MFPFFISYVILKAKAKGNVTIMNKNFFCASKTPCTFDNHVPATYLRHTFEVSGSTEHATLTVTATGFYILYVNGKNITKKFKKVLTYLLFCDNIEKLSDGTAVGH